MKRNQSRILDYLASHPNWTVSFNRTTGVVTYRVGERVVAIEVNGKLFLESK